MITRPLDGSLPRVHISFTPPEGVRPLLTDQPWDLSWAPSAGGQPRRDLLRDIVGAHAVITLLSDRVDGALMDAAGPGLRVVANYAVGYDNVDVDAAQSRGIAVTNTPGVLDEATADLTMALLLATARRVVEADRFVRSGQAWSWRPDLFTGLDISAGTTLGIVGLGRIGLAVARRASAFDMRVVATATRGNAREAERLGIELLPLDDLLRRSDAVSLHCPLNRETRHLIGKRELLLLGSQGILINTARGAIVDEEALAEALAAGELGAAGLDVYENEPSVHPTLLSLPNVVLLPHIGSAGTRTRDRMAEVAIDNVRAVLKGEPPVTPVK